MNHVHVISTLSYLNSVMPFILYYPLSKRANEYNCVYSCVYSQHVYSGTLILISSINDNIDLKFHFESKFHRNELDLKEKFMDCISKSTVPKII